MVNIKVIFQRNGKLKNMEDLPEQISIEQRLL